MELKDLVGKHKLNAVDFSEESIKRWGDIFEDCQVCRFRLDGVVYLAVEDPDDGYRSAMRELNIDENAKMKNLFNAVDVVARYRTKGIYDNDSIYDILEIINADSGAIILSVGTESIDGYYPEYVARFHPENIGVSAYPCK